jgi:hypothetical protein
VIERVVNAPVVLGPVPAGLPSALVDRRGPGGGGLVADAREALFRVPGLAAFHVADGACVTVEPEPGADDHAIDAYLHGTVAALVLAQRGEFALHASVVRMGERALAICGRRGVGKSTTVLALARRGHTVLSDDVAVLEVGDDGLVHRPTGRPLHVAADAAVALDLETEGALPVERGDGKLAVPLAPAQPGRLDGIVVLRTGPVAAPSLVAREARGAIPLLVRHTFRSSMLGALHRAELFAWAAAVAQRVPVAALVRPDDGWTVDTVADAVEALASERAAA